VALHDVFAAVTPLLPAALKSFFGAKNLPKAGVPPRIVWVPSSDRFGPPVGPGRNPNAKWTRKAGCVVHIWGASHADIEGERGLLNAFLTALYQVAHGSIEILGGEWATEEEQSALAHGEAYLLSFAVDVPVVSVAKRDVVITSVEEACEAQG
jgi:hypothetical protein